MIPALRSEFRKLFTVRSTYITTVMVALLVILISLWPQGIKLMGAELQDPTQLSGDITGVMTAVGIFAGVVAILLMSHEYRYNTIMYTLTATNSRLKTLLAKFVAVSAYGVTFAALMSTLAPLSTLLGVHLAGHHLGPQTIDFGSVVWRSLYVGWGMAMAGLVLAVIIRNQIGAIVTILVTPLVLESFLGLLIKNGTAYLPFHALSAVVQPSSQLSSLEGAGLFACYLVAAWLAATFLFLKRDAN